MLVGLIVKRVMEGSLFWKNARICGPKISPRVIALVSRAANIGSRQFLRKVV
jgi:hypothetical protein